MGHDCEAGVPVKYERNEFFCFLIFIGIIFSFFVDIPMIIQAGERGNTVMTIYYALSLLASYAWTLKILIDKPFLLRGNLRFKCLIHLIFALCQFGLAMLAHLGYETLDSSENHILSFLMYVFEYLLQVNWKYFRPYMIASPPIIYSQETSKTDHWRAASTTAMPAT
jgi:hypothetical protein